MKKMTFLVLLSVLMYSCGWSFVESSNSEDIGMIEGVRPIYGSYDTWQNITTTDSKDIEHLGKIYYYNGYIFVNELHQGIHIIDNRDSHNPVPLKFINIPGNKDIAIKDNYMYVDNYTDLVTLDVSDLDNIHEVHRISNIYPAIQQSYPEFYTGYFECADPSKGIVIGWEEAIIENPECRR